MRPELWQSLRGSVIDDRLDTLLMVHGAHPIAAFAANETNAGTDVWIATDLRLLVCRLGPSQEPADGLLLWVKATMTAWRDVRDVEVDSDIARLTHKPPKDGRIELAGYASEIRRTVQLPRLHITVNERDRIRQLAGFMRAVLIEYNGATR